MAPFADDDAIVEQQQTRVRADHRLQRRLVGIAERVFRTRDVLPAADALMRACRKTIELIAVLETILVDAVQPVELRVVGILQMGRNEQERVALTSKHRFRDVLALVCALYEELCVWRVLTFQHALPSLSEIRPYVIGAEVELGEGIEASACDDHKDEER